MTDLAIQQSEKDLVLELLPACLNESGIMLALPDLRNGTRFRLLRILRELEREGSIYRESLYVWKVREEEAHGS